MNNNKDPLGLLKKAEEEIEVSRSNFLLTEGDGIKLYDRIYKVSSILKNGKKIILKRIK